MFNYKITKYIDLDNNDGLSAIENHAAQQHHDVYIKFYNLIQTTRPSRILEIGTALGGFTHFLSMTCRDLDLPTKILSYDVSEKSWYKDIGFENTKVIVKNIFNDKYSELEDNSVIDFIQSDGLSIILCDGGLKKAEFNILSRYIKNYDLIMAHDYATTSSYFNESIKNKIWNWHEIQLSDIQESVKKYSLKPFMYEEMLSVVWGSFRKEI